MGISILDNARGISIGVLWAVLFLAALCATGPARASEGPYLSGAGPIQMGTTGAGAASPKDSAWMLINPAGIVALERRLDSYVMLADIRRTVEPKGLLANPFAGDMSDASGAVFPGMGLVLPFEWGTLGFGTHGIAGTQVDYPRPRAVLGLPTNSDRRFQYNVLHLPITYAYQFDNGWAVGGSLIPILSRFRSDTLTTNLRPPEANFDWDKEVGLGFNVGVWKKWDRWAVSAMYSSRIWTRAFSEYKDLLKSPLDLPPELRLGVAWQATETLELLLDYRFIHWRDVAIYETSNREGGVDWRNQHLVKAGAEWQARPKWAFRGGVTYGESPIKEETVFVNALYTAFSEWHFGLGATYAMSDRSEFHVALSHSPETGLTDNGQGDLFSKLGRGTKADYRETIVTLGHTWKF
jgi:long-chain fatty acid transport protein